MTSRRQSPRSIQLNGRPAARAFRRLDAGGAPLADRAVSPAALPAHRGIWFWLLRLYLGLFVFVAPDRGHARREHLLIEGSVADAYAYHRRRGVSSRRAAMLTFREHLAELQPIALAQKTRSDARFGPRSRYPYWSRLAAAPMGFFIVIGGAFGVWDMTRVAEAGQEPVRHTVARVFASDDPRAGQVEIVGEFATSREAIFAATGGAVCLPPGTTSADFPSGLPMGTPDHSDECADLQSH